MYGHLRGTLMEKHADSVILDVNGVGYEVTVPASSICILPPEGNTASLYIHTYIKESLIRLFGFATFFDKKIFETLISVSSVGPKTALTLLGPLEGKEVCQAISASNTDLLTRIPGVGAKTAERIVLELKTKIQKILILYDEYQDSTDILNLNISKNNSSPDKNPHNERTSRKLIVEDLRSALLNLGYKEKQITDILSDYEQKAKSGEEIILESALKEILKKLSGHLFSK